MGFRDFLKDKDKQPTTTQQSSGGFKSFLASKAPAPTQTSAPNFTGPTLQPRGPQPQFVAPAGGVQLAYNKWRTPSGSIWEYEPDGTRIVHLAAQFGGGSFKVDPNRPGELIKSERDYAGVPSMTGNERDHIIPVSLGGISTKRTNIRSVPEDQNPAEFEAEIARQLKAGKITLEQARLAVMTKKQEMFMNTPKTGVWDNFLEGFASVPSEAKKAVGIEPKSQGMTFAVGEGLNDQQKHAAQATLERSSISEQNRQQLRRETGGEAMDAPKTFKDFLRAPLRGLVQITNPDKVIEPLEQDHSQLFRFIYGDEPLKGYSYQAAEAETRYKEQGLGKLATPLAVLEATGTASMDLAPFYAPMLKAVNEELSGIAKARGTKPLTLTYKDLQDITSGKLTSGEKYDAFKAVGKDLDLKNLAPDNVLKTEDTLLKRSTEPVQDFFKPRETTYTAAEPKPKFDPFEVKALPAAEAPKYDPFKPKVEDDFVTKPVRSSKVEVTETKPVKVETPEVTKPKPVEVPKVEVPVTTVKPTKLQSSVYKRLQNEIPEELREDVNYGKMNLQQNADNAVELVAKDKTKAYRIAMGVETPPAGQTQTAVSIAMAERALEEKNYKLFSQLTKQRSLEQTRRGQEIVSEKGSVADNSTARYVKEVLKARMESVNKKYLSDLSPNMLKLSKGRRVIKHIDDEVKKIQKTISRTKELDLDEAQKLIDSLAC